MQQALAVRLFSLDGVVERPSRISVPGARALVLRDDVPAGPREAFLIGREFAHLHPPYDGSLHAALPQALAEEAMAAGWAELHPAARRGLIPTTIVMIYGPRDETELEVVARLVEASLAWARGG
jgi:phospholipase/carboxylesterase